MIEMTKLPPGQLCGSELKMTVNGRSCSVGICRVSALPFNIWWKNYQRPIDQSELAYFASIASDELLRIEVTAAKPFSRAVVRPLSKKVETKVENNTVKLVIERDGQFVLELDDEHFALHIFVNKLTKFDSEVATYSFGAGIHNVGLINLKSGDRVFVDDGAVVYGSIYGDNVDNVKIYGHGVLDGGWEQRHSSKCYTAETCGCIKLYNSTNITIEGVILRDSAIWVLNLFGCNQVDVQNIKILGHWKYNCDGIDIVNSSNVSIRNSFVRAFDDAITLKGILFHKDKDVKNILVDNCICWCGWGRTLEIGLETIADNYENITFRECDLIHNSAVAMDINSGDYANIHDVLFQNIRIEYQQSTLPEVIQHELTDSYTRYGETHVPTLIVIKIIEYLINDSEHVEYDKNLVVAREGRKCSISNIRYENIEIIREDNIAMPQIVIDSPLNNFSISGIHMQNFTVNGVKVNRIEEFAYTKNSEIKDVDFS